jgi:hypothetical protein
MQLRKTSALLLYVGSYLPLGLILLAQDIDLNVLKSCPAALASHKAIVCFSLLQHPRISLTVVGASTICLVLTLIILRKIKTRTRVSISESKHIPADLINYVVPYIVSFMGLDYDSPIKLIGFSVFFFWIFWITYRSGQIIMNPILIVFGWRLYEIKFKHLQSENELNGTALSKVDIDPNNVYYQANLQDVMIIKEQR